ncbi:hypothetical protein J8J14_18220 [Roseomonas sp. SSH11]|uniref:Uncharacterized protein n=1 Tax=Pararoseomonas baculiformis TaxID=2820812 RepID=A0ABS4AI95_9PROT|nr:hypothetical protein [Pararoseomonas baculiformis]MBP0446716.1 hypothetical protein [Pararoseomonas baculiformis]
MATQAEVAAHLGLSQQAVSALIQRAILPGAAGKGGLDLDACRLAYVRHLREVAAGRASAESGEGLDLVQERARLAAEQADATAMKNAITRGELVPAGDLERVFGALVSSARERFLALPYKAAPLVIGKATPVEAQAVLTDLVHEALLILASGETSRAFAAMEAAEAAATVN